MKHVLLYCFLINRVCVYSMNNQLSDEYIAYELHRIKILEQQHAHNHIGRKAKECLRKLYKSHQNPDYKINKIKYARNSLIMTNLLIDHEGAITQEVRDFLDREQTYGSKSE